MKFYVSNPFQRKGKKNATDIREYNLVKFLEDKYTPKPYSQKWKGAFFSAVGFSYLFNFYSLLTGVFAIATLIYNNIFNNLGFFYSLTIALILATIVAILLELVKRATNSVGFSTYFVSKNDPDVSSDIIINLIVITVLSLVSIGLSVLACYQIPRTTSPPPTFFSVESELYNQPFYNKKIALFQNQLNDLKKEREHTKKTRMWKGRISTKDQKQIDKFNTKIYALQDSITALAANKEIEVKQTYQKRKKQHKEQNKYAFLALSLVTVCSETAFIFCMFYKEKYLWKSACERIDQFTATPTNGTTLNVNGQRGRQIGYNLNAKTESQEFNVYDGKRIKPCEYCNKPMVYKNANKRFCSDSCRWKSWHEKNKSK